MVYFLTSSNSGALPSASVPMSFVSLSEFQKDLIGETSVFASFPSFMGSAPMYLAPTVLGTTFPFSGWKDGVEEFDKQRVNVVKEALSDKSPLGIPFPIFTAAPDTTPLLVRKLIDFDWGKYSPIKANEHTLAVMEPGDTIFPEFIPATSYTLDTCSLLSEIQRHMLEATIDGGITWSDLWTKSEVQRFFNNRLSRFFLETGVIQEEFSVDTSPGLSEYNYPGDLIQAKRLTFEQDLSLYDDLVSFFRLQEASGSRLDSIGDNNLTPFNTPLQVTGKIGYGIGLTRADDDGVYKPGATTLNPGTGDFSLSCWINPTTLPSAGEFYSLLSKGATGAAVLSPGYWIFLRSTGLSLAFGDSSTIVRGCQMNTTFLPDLNTWTNIVVVFVRSGYVQVYANGTRIFPSSGSDDISFFGSTTSASTPTAPFAIGVITANTNILTPVIGDSFNGSIDAVGYWSRALTPEEVEVLYNEGEGRELFPAQHDGPYEVLPRQDPFSQDNGVPGWQDEEGIPSIIIEEPRSPLSFQLSPTPNVEGSVEGIYVRDPDDISDACTPLPIPNYLGWIIKYGVMSDMLRKEGEANDPVRAQYCESRWQEGVQLTRVLLGFNDDYGSEEA